MGIGRPLGDWRWAAGFIEIQQLIEDEANVTTRLPGATDVDGLWLICNVGLGVSGLK